jgi:hypothetical protein
MGELSVRGEGRAAWKRRKKQDSGFGRGRGMGDMENENYGAFGICLPRPAAKKIIIFSISYF